LGRAAFARCDGADWASVRPGRDAHPTNENLFAGPPGRAPTFSLWGLSPDCAYASLGYIPHPNKHKSLVGNPGRGYSPAVPTGRLDLARAKRIP